MSKLGTKKKIIIPVCIVIVVAILLGMVMYLLPEKEIVQYNYNKEKQTGYSFGKNYTPYVITGDNTLYVNEKTSAVAIASNDGKVVFNSNSESAAKNKLASVVSLTLRDKAGNVYTQNSTDNSKFEITTERKNDVTITFKFNAIGDNSEIVPVKFFEENGGFKAEVDLDEVVLKDGFCVEKISILPGLFSENAPTKNTFYTVPDGSGAQIDLTASAKKVYSKNLSMYGTDITFEQYSQGANLPCFSMTKNQSMLTVVIDDGDALSSLFVKHNKGQGGSLYNTFSVTSYGKIDGKLKKGSSYNGKVSQVYYLTSDSFNNYNTIASLVRDNLQEKGYLPDQMSDTFVDFPFFITAIGSENGKKNTTYTTFENASEMLALLKSRGVRCMALRLSGFGKDGLNSGARKADKLSEALGGEKAYNVLCSVAEEKNSTVWYDVNLAVTPKNSSNTNLSLYSDFREYISKADVNSSVASYNFVDNNISSIYKFASDSEVGEICVNDLSYVLYTDLSGGINRQAALDSLREKTGALSVSGGLMLSKPAVYLMNQADAVFEMPQNSSLEEYEGVKNVPLLQMVLHGSLCYGSQPINLNADGTDAVLKAVEYGASPSFVFTHSNCDVLDYGVYSTQIAKYYATAKRMLPLIDMKITSHEQVVSGVYKVTYDYNKVVYINYNPSVVEVNGILVSAKDFVVI